MEHLAIMSKGYIEKILEGQKKIESRFSKNKITPYMNISKGDTVYLQETGKMVTAMFRVKDVLFFQDLSPVKIQEIRKKYGDDICADDEFWQMKINSQYATLIFIDNPIKITPFKVFKNDRSAFKTTKDVKKDFIFNKRPIIKHCHDCSNGKHYFIYDGTTKCEFCGQGFNDSSLMKHKPDYFTIKEIMKQSMWNDEWLNTTWDNTALANVSKINDKTIRNILLKSIKELNENDGKQTPYYGNAIYYAQHGLGCCCRKCLEKFYGIPQNKRLSDEEIDYFVGLIKEFITDRV